MSQTIIKMEIHVKSYFVSSHFYKVLNYAFTIYTRYLWHHKLGHLQNTKFRLIISGAYSTLKYEEKSNSSGQL